MVMNIGDAVPDLSLPKARTDGCSASSTVCLPLRAMPRLALVHDYLLVLRGAERTFAAMADVWPDAPIVTLLYDEDGHRGPLRGARR